MKPAPKPPDSLSSKAREQWEKYQSYFTIDDEHGLFLLDQAMAAYDRSLTATAAIKKHGNLIMGSKGTLINNPQLAVEHQAQLRMLACLKQLEIEVTVQSHKPGPKPNSGVRR